MNVKKQCFNFPLGKRIIFLLVALILVNSSVAIESHYSLDLNYFDGVINFKGIHLLGGMAPKISGSGEYTLRIVSFYNTILQEQKFDISENGDFTLYIPYYKGAEEIVIFRDYEKVFGYDVSSFADVCGDGTCQFHESYESCKGDCPSGLNDDFCDMVEEGKCDPDCGELDPDCEVNEQGKKPVEEKGIVRNEGLTEGKATVVRGEPGERASLLYYIVPSLLVVVLIIFGIFLLSRHKTNKQSEERLRKYIDDNLKRGYTPEQIKGVLLNQGYGDKEINNLFNF